MDRLIDKSPEEIQKEGIHPRGTLEEWKSSLEEIVLVGLVSSKEEYNRYIQEGYYSIPVEKLKRGWHEAKYVALYVKNGIELENGVVVYGKIQEVRSVCLNGMDVIRFSVPNWVNKNPIIRPVNYGISSYILTTLNALKEATELPELFIKSQEELLMWRRLRRVSDRINIGMDHKDVDEATQVVEFSLRDVRVIFNKANEKILFFKEGQQLQEIRLRDLYRNPAGAFKGLMEILSP